MLTYCSRAEIILYCTRNCASSVVLLLYIEETEAAAFVKKKQQKLDVSFSFKFQHALW